MLNGFLIRSIFVGAFWGLLNVFLLVRLVALLGVEEVSRQRRKLILLLAAKFGLLYPAGIWLLWSSAVDRIGFAVGFTATLAVVTAALVRLKPVKIFHV